MADSKGILENYPSVQSRQEKWDTRFLELARHVAGWSKDPSTKTGAVIVDRNRMVRGVGYNGFPALVEDSPERYANRDLKYKMMVHCERNALVSARAFGGFDEETTLYTWPFMSCAPCAALMIQAGIKRVVAPYSDNPRWKEDFDLSAQMFKEAGVRVELVQGFEGRTEAAWLLDAIVASIREYPATGCDDKVAMALDALIGRVTLPRPEDTPTSDYWVRFAQLAVCDPREAVKGNHPSPGEAITKLVDTYIAVDGMRKVGLWKD